MAFQLSIYTDGKFSPTQATEDSKKERESRGLIYDLVGARGRSMKVYEDHVLIFTDASKSSLFNVIKLV